jgi:hypothetical protein
LGDVEWRIEVEGVRAEAQHREVLRSAVAFEKEIRNRCRRKNRERNDQISALEV